MGGLIFQTQTMKASCDDASIMCATGTGGEGTNRGWLFHGASISMCSSISTLFLCAPCNYTWHDLSNQCNNTYSKCSGGCTAVKVYSKSRRTPEVKKNTPPQSKSDVKYGKKVKEPPRNPK